MHRASEEAWRRTTLGAVARRLVNGGTPPTEIEAFWNGTIPWITGADFTSRGVEEFRRFVSDAAVRLTSTNVIQRGQLLIVTRTGVGKLALAPCDIAISQDITGLYVDETTADSRFLFHRMRAGVLDLKKLNQGTSINGIIRSDLTAYKLDLPPLPVQRRIAGILATLDAAIDQTEDLITKLRAIMSGLTHDLLTRGVNSCGQLRPVKRNASGLYKKSSIGWIPTEWSTKKCHEICEKITVGIVVRPVQYYVDQGVPALRSANIREDGIVEDNFVFISEKSNALLAKSQVRTGDIVSVRTGYPGTSAVIPEELSGANCIDILISRPSASIAADFLALWINSSFGKDQVLRKQGGLAQQHFNVGELRELVVALPPPAEQERILARITAVSGRIKTEILQKDKFLKIKEALSRNLLRAPSCPSNGGYP